jgi:dihydroorotase
MLRSLHQAWNRKESVADPTSSDSPAPYGRLPCYRWPRMSAPAELLVIRGARAVDPTLSLDATVDVVIERGRITRLGPHAGAEPARGERARVIEGAGRWVLPAFVDLHAHLREPGQEYKEDIASGLSAAAAGGYAHVCAMPNTQPVNDTRAVTEMMLHRAAEHGGPTLHPIGAITKRQEGKELTEMAELRAAGAVAVSDDGVCVMSSAVMRRALEYAKNFDLPVIQHAEDHQLTAGADIHEGTISARLGLRGWPRIAEDVIVARDILLAEYVGARYHVAHVSTQGSARLVREAKSRHIEVTCEVTPHHLLLTDAALLGYDTACKVNPPLREEADVAALLEALADGTIDAIATDHAPHTPLEKDCELSVAKPGLMGLELCFGLLLGLVGRSRLTLERLIDALSARPARIVGIEAPRLREGALAELTLIDPTALWKPESVRLHSKSRNTPFMSRELTGKVLLTLARGIIVHDAGGDP